MGFSYEWLFKKIKMIKWKSHLDTDFVTRELSRVDLSDEAGSEETGVLFGLDVVPLTGAENYMFGGTGDFYGQYKTDNSASGGNQYDPFTYSFSDLTDLHPFVVKVLEGAGKIEGLDVVNNFSKTFVFNKEISTTKDTAVDDILNHSSLSRTFHGCPFQVFAHVQEYTDSSDLSTAEQTASLLTPDDAIFRDAFYTGAWVDGWQPTYPDPIQNYDPVATAMHALRPGMKVQICADEFSKSGSTYSTDYQDLIAEAYVAFVHPIQYVLVPADTSASVFYLDPISIDKFLRGELTTFPKISKIVTMFAVFYHRFAFEPIVDSGEDFNFGHLLERDSYTVAKITDGSTEVLDATITKYRVKFMVEDQQIDIGLVSDTGRTVFNNVTMDAKYDDLTRFRILPNIEEMDAAQKKKYFPGYPLEIKTPIDSLHYPYEKSVNTIEITTAIDKTANISGPDVPHPDYFSIDFEADSIDDSFVEVDSVLGYYQIDAGNFVVWMTKNDENLMSRMKSDDETYKYGQNLFPEYDSTDARKISALKGLSKNIEAYGVVFATLTFASETERDSAKAAFEACGGPFMYAHINDADAPTTMRNFNSNPNTYKFLGLFPFAARVFDWADGANSDELDIAYAQITCIDTFESSSGSVTDYYQHQFNSYYYYMPSVDWDYIFFYDGRTDSTYRYHDIVADSGGTDPQMAAISDQTLFLIDSVDLPQPARGTRYWSIPQSGVDQAIEPIFPHSPLFRYTMPNPISGDLADRRSLVHQNDTEVSVLGYGKKLHDGTAGNLIEHEIIFKSLADELSIADDNEMLAQMHKTKEAFGVYYENLNTDDGYHVVSKFNVGFNADNAVVKRAQDAMTEVPFVGFAFDNLSAMLDSAKTEGWHGYVKLNYDVWLPSTAHFYANRENEITYSLTAPGMLSLLDQIFLPGVLYIGSCHIPPEGFHGYSFTRQNLPERIVDFFQKMQLAADSARIKAATELQDTHARTLRTGTPVVSSGSTTDGVTIDLECIQHRFDNPYVLDLFLLQPQDQRDNFTALFGTAFGIESDIARPNTKTSNFDRENNEVSQETIPVFIHSSNTSGLDFWDEGSALESYVHNGKRYVTIAPVGQREIISTGDYRSYTETVEASYLDSDLYPGLKIKAITFEKDGAHSVSTSLWDYGQKLYDTCRNAGFGQYLSPSYFKMQQNGALCAIRAETESFVPLARLHFKSDASDTFIGRNERVGQLSSIDVVDSLAARFLAVISLGNNSNDAISRQNFRKSRYSTGLNDSLDMGFFSFGEYTVPVECYYEVYPNEVDYYNNPGKFDQLRLLTMNFGGVPVLQSNFRDVYDDYGNYAWNFVTNEWQALAVLPWSNYRWADIVHSSQSGKVDATADYLQSFMPAGRHALGFVSRFDSLGDDGNDVPHCGTFTVLKLGDKMRRTDRTFDHIFSSTIDPHIYTFSEEELTDGDYLIDSTNSQSNKQNMLVPKVAQSWKFAGDCVLKSVKLYFANDPWVSNTFEEDVYAGGNAFEKIAVYFGYLINGKLDPDGFVHTEFIERSELGADYSVLKQLALPLFVKGGKEFFVGVLHINHSGSNETPALQVKVIKNGAYAVGDKSLLPFPSESNSMIVDKESFSDRSLKIDLNAFIYPTIDSSIANRSVVAANIVSGRSASYYKPSRISRFFFVDDPIVPEETGIDYFWSDGDVDIVNPFTPGKETTLPDVAADFSVKAVLRTTDPSVSPIFKAGTSPLIVLHEPLKYDTGNTHFYNLNDDAQVISADPFTDLASHMDSPAFHSIVRPFKKLDDFARDFFDRNFSSEQSYAEAFWSGTAISVDHTQAVNGTILEIELNNLKSNTQMFPVYVEGVKSGFSPFGFWKSEEEYNNPLLPTFNFEATFPAHIFRLQLDFYDPSFDPNTMAFKDIPFGLYYKQVGYKSFETQLLDMSNALPVEEIAWRATIAYPYNYCYQGTYLESPGVTVDIRPLEGNWFRQTIEFMPIGYEYDFNHTVAVVNSINKALPTFNFSVKPRVIWPLEDYQFLLRIGIENQGDRSMIVKNVKTSFDTVMMKMSYGGVAYLLAPWSSQLSPVVGTFTGVFIGG